MALILSSGCSLDWSYPEAAGGGGNGGGGGGVAGTDCVGPRISIVSPENGSTVTHGTIPFEANVVCGEPPPDSIIWEVSGNDGIFAVGYSHDSTINAVATFDLWVAVMDGGDVIASDMITFSTE